MAKHKKKRQPRDQPRAVQVDERPRVGGPDDPTDEQVSWNLRIRLERGDDEYEIDERLGARPGRETVELLVEEAATTFRSITGQPHDETHVWLNVASRDDDDDIIEMLFD